MLDFPSLFQVLHNFLTSFLLFFLSPSQFSLSEGHFGYIKMSPQPVISGSPQHLKYSGELRDYTEKLSKKEAQMVMGKLGLFGGEESAEEAREAMGEDEVSEMLEEEFSLEEVKKAFDVFDENKDGLISGRELRRVLNCLGLETESELDKFEMMIKAADEDGDGKVDFNEFAKFLQMCFR